MSATKRACTGKTWWHLGASGLLQPLSEDFLYRSPQSPPSGSWCALHGGADKGRQKHA